MTRRASADFATDIELYAVVDGKPAQNYFTAGHLPWAAHIVQVSFIAYSLAALVGPARALLQVLPSCPSL